jgi:hypothetical protein
VKHLLDRGVCLSLGSGPGELYAYQPSTGWYDTDISSYEFSAGSGTTTVHAALYDPYSLSPTSWDIESIDWIAHHKRWVCPTLASVP